MQDAWATLIQSAQAGSLEASISASLLQSWLQLAATPAGQPLDASLLLDTSNKFSSQVGPAHSFGGQKESPSSPNICPSYRIF